MNDKKFNMMDEIYGSVIRGSGIPKELFKPTRDSTNNPYLANTVLDNNAFTISALELMMEEIAGSEKKPTVSVLFCHTKKVQKATINGKEYEILFEPGQEFRIEEETRSYYLFVYPLFDDEGVHYPLGIRIPKSPDDEAVYTKHFTLKTYEVPA